MFTQLFAGLEMNGIFRLGDKFFASFRVMGFSWWTVMQAEATETANLDSTALAQLSAHLFNDAINTECNVLLR